MTGMTQLLQAASERGLLRSLDIQFASMIASDAQPALMLAAALVSAEAGEGHVCLPVEQLTEAALFAGRHPELAHLLWQAAQHPDWSQVLSESDAVGNGDEAKPLVFDNQRLYLHRLWRAEGRAAQFFVPPVKPAMFDEQQVRSVLDRHFGPEGDNWQKIAAAVAITRQISVISGGPGTGKTTTVAKLLAALLALSTIPLRIRLAAPTGKAAARLTESLGAALQKLDISAEDKQHFPAEATTLHRLLGAVPGSQRMRYHQGNPLHLDVLVVDEASMVDLTMMANLIAALPDSARVIFLGDRDQLASVEAGAVLGDICRCAEAGYSLARAAELSRLTGCDIDGHDDALAPPVRDSICLLRKSYRFDASSGIGQLAAAVNAGNVRQSEQAFVAGFSDIARFPLSNTDDYQQLLAACVSGYEHYLRALSRGAAPADVLQEFAHFQLLCALREGPFGVMGLNERIELALQRKGLIRRQSAARGKWYVGRPVMIARNDSALGLFNGDIGIAMNDGEGELKVWFPLPDGTIKAVQPSRLPPHDTAFAMTVHKSQGSEFAHTLLVLPNQFTPVLTRELVYTAITRAKSQLTLFADPAVMNNAIRMRTLRRSGLVERLVQLA